MLRYDLESLTINNDNNIAYINGIPDETDVLSVQWNYRDRMMLCSLPINLTKSEITNVLYNMMIEIDDNLSISVMIGEEL